MDLAYLQTLADYHYWARDRVLAAVAPLTPEQYQKDLGNSFPSVCATLNHVYLAEWAWLERWNGQAPKGFPPPDTHPTHVDSLRTHWSAQEQRVRAFLASVGTEGVNRVFDYTLFSGATGRSTFWEMFSHVVNHASYHRGQVTTMLRQLGAKPGESMDMITFYRTRADAPR